MRVLEELAGRIRRKETGALAWTDGQRRRILWLEAGELVLLQSNLKSESMERVNERTPGLKPADVRIAALTARIAGLLGEQHGGLEWMDGEAPAQRDPADIVALMGGASLSALPAECCPRAVGANQGWIARLPATDAVRDYLRSLDGLRPLEDVLEFGPAEPSETDQALRLAWALGAIVDGSAEADSYTTTAAAKGRTVTQAHEGGIDDIAGLIAAELGVAKRAAPDAPPDPLGERFGAALPRIRAAETHFQVLGVGWQDPPETMRRAYFGLARELHPDRYTSDSAELIATAAELFDKVRAAWEMLGDDSKREAYIAKVIRGEKTEEELTMDKLRTILDAEADFKRGLNEFYAGRVAQAHELFQRVVEAVPDQAEFQAYAGYTTFRTNTGRDEAKATAGAERVLAAVQTNDRLDAGYVLIGLIERHKGNDAEAKQAFIQALKIKPSNPDAVRELKRMETRNTAAVEEKSGLFNKLFGSKKK